MHLFVRAVALAAVVLSAMPVQAQQSVPFEGDRERPRRLGAGAICLMDHQVNRWLEARGWDNVRRGSQHGFVIETRGERDGMVWAVFVNLCDRRIVEAEQLRPAR